MHSFKQVQNFFPGADTDSDIDEPSSENAPHTELSENVLFSDKNHKKAILIEAGIQECIAEAAASAMSSPKNRDHFDRVLSLLRSDYMSIKFARCIYEMFNWDKSDEYLERAEEIMDMIHRDPSVPSETRAQLDTFFNKENYATNEAEIKQSLEQAEHYFFRPSISCGIM